MKRSASPPRLVTRYRLYFHGGFLVAILVCSAIANSNAQWLNPYFPGRTVVPDKAQLSELKRALHYSNNDREKTELLLKISGGYLANKKTDFNFDSLNYYASQAGVLARKIKDEKAFQEHVLILATGNATQSYHNHTPYDNVLKLLSLTTDSTRIKLLYAIGMWYELKVLKNTVDYEHFEYVDSIVYYGYKALDASVRDKEWWWRHLSENMILVTATNILESARRFDQSERIIIDFEKRNKNSKDLPRAKIYYAYGSLYRKRGDYEKAIEYLHRTKEVIESSKTNLNAFQLSELRIWTATALSSIYEKVGEPEKCVETLRPVMHDLANPKINYGLYSFVWTMARNLNKLNRPKETIEIVNAAYPYHPISAKNDSMAISLSLGTANLALKQYPEAEKYLLTAQRIAGKNRVYFGVVYGSLVDLYIKTKDLGKAELYIDLYDKNVRFEKDMSRADIYLAGFKIDSAKGNFTTAIEKYQKSRQISDSINGSKKINEYRNLEIKYKTAEIQNNLLQKENDVKSLTQNARILHQETELAKQSAFLQALKLEQAELLTAKNEANLKLKDQNIEFLSKQGALQQAQIKQESMIRNITIVVIALLAVILGLLFRQYILKQRSNSVITQKNKLLEQLVTEKNWLLKEMHHRVKNNLQTIVSLLESQSTFLVNNEALSAIQDSQNRVNSMSLIHQKLYQSENLQYIDMSSYLPELIHYLKDSFDTHHTIRFNADIQAVALDVTQAIPIGLIINEAVTNSIKYAFQHSNRTPEINVTMREENELITLVIEDNGNGLPADFDSSRIRQGLGLNLIRGLSEDIEGNFTIHSSNGVRIEISFKVNAVVGAAIA